ncbi:serine/threonine-protein kinase [Salinibacter ruber]|uniref:serine/threonine-protein kinase n=1 Tax=Salinibacter ruber TaxID=146919 RepID=UPI001F08299B|nr:serine/threonine-protein kinase [Salinibacter ruber]
MPDAGDILDGYRLDAVIGRGGMGTVYRATDQALEKTVALKVIAPHLADDDTFVRRFREEAKALARLDADGIVDVYTLRETEEALFFVMEHVEGPSLETVLRRRGQLEPPQALSLLRQVLTAVGHAHASGVLHRDLKPSNILIDADGQAVITDFGLAKILASDADLTATHDQLGTVAYMSPEQVKGLQNVDAASDLFAVGLLAYEVLTGRLPFDRSGSDFVVQRAIVDASFPPPSTHAPEVPPAVEQVVLDLLSKDPAARPPDARAALDRLPAPEAADEEPLLTPDAPPLPRRRLHALAVGRPGGRDPPGADGHLRRGAGHPRPAGSLRRGPGAPRNDPDGGSPSRPFRTGADGPAGGGRRRALFSRGGRVPGRGVTARRCIARRRSPVG